MATELLNEELEQVIGGRFHKSQQGIVRITNCKHGMYARTEPGSQERVAFVHLNEEFPYYGSSNGWVKIKVNGKFGYVKKALTIVID